MAGKDCDDFSSPLSGAGTTNGVLPVVSTTGFFASGIASIAKTADGSLAATLKIVKVLDDTHVQVRLEQQRFNNSVSQAFETNYALRKPNYGFSDMSSYDATYTLYLPSQFIYGLS